MTRGMLGVLLIAGILLSAGAESLSDQYRKAYDERMATAADREEVQFLTRRYDGALGKLYEEAIRKGKKEVATLIAAERKRVRTLEKVQAADVFKNELPLIDSNSEPVELPETRFFGIKQKCKRPVFLIMSGPAITTPNEGQSNASARMGFHIVQIRMAEAIERLPEYAMFNAAVFWNGNTSPYAPHPRLATPENKQEFSDWLMPLNAISVEGSYVTSIQKVANELKRTGMKKPLGMNARSGSPQWLYDYQTSPAFRQAIGGNDRHWLRALCFAFEQKADAIYLITSNNVIGSKSLSNLLPKLEDAVVGIYGEDDLPNVHLIVSQGTGKYRGDLNGVRNSFKSLQKAFDGKAVLIRDIESWMTDDEQDLFKGL